MSMPILAVPNKYHINLKDVVRCTSPGRYCDYFIAFLSRSLGVSGIDLRCTVAHNIYMIDLDEETWENLGPVEANQHIEEVRNRWAT